MAGQERGINYFFPPLIGLPDLDPFELTDEEKEALKVIDEKIAAITKKIAKELSEAQKERMTFLRMAAYDKNLADPDIIRLAEKLLGDYLGINSITLEAREGIKFVRLKTKDGNAAGNAYLCRNDLLGKEEGCGWVIGEPCQQQFKDVGFLGGWEGQKLFCRICGMYLGDRTEIQY